MLRIQAQTIRELGCKEKRTRDTRKDRSSLFIFYLLFFFQAAKKKRQLHEKVFKGGAKTLAEDDEEEDAASWVRKMREAEERKAAERERMMTEMEEEATKAGDKEKEKDKAKKHRIKVIFSRTVVTFHVQKPKTFDTAGMVIGHSRDTFAEMQDQILVLEDKSNLLCRYILP